MNAERFIMRFSPKVGSSEIYQFWIILSILHASQALRSSFLYFFIKKTKPIVLTNVSAGPEDVLYD